MKKKFLSGFFSVATAAGLLLGSLPSMSGFVAAATEEASASSYAGQGYFSYLAGCPDSDMTYDSTDVVLSASSAMTEDGVPASLNDTDGTPAAVLKGDEDSLYWSFETLSDGYYCLSVKYYPLEDTVGDAECSLKIDDDAPFNNLSSIVFPKAYTDSVYPFEKNEKGNDRKPEQKELARWMTIEIGNGEGENGMPYRLYLKQGTHKITLTGLRQSLAISEIRLSPPEELISYGDYKAENTGKPDNAGDEIILIEAEKTKEKTSSSVIPQSDRSDPASVPASASSVLLNTIGGTGWSRPSQTISWSLTVTKAGFYNIGMRYKQKYLRGLSVYRRIEIDGKCPFEGMQAVQFGYSSGWETCTVGGDEQYSVYFEAGEHTLSMTPVTGVLGELCEQAQLLVYEINGIYRQIMMITGSTPDAYRDYNLKEAIPGLQNTLKEKAKQLREMYDTISVMTADSGSEAVSLLRLAEQLESFAKQPDSIQNRLSSFNGNISNMSSWVLGMSDSALALDSIWLSAGKCKTPAARAGIAQSVAFHAKAFVSSFINDYSEIGTSGENNKSVRVWISSGRDQADIIKEMADSRFTPETGIGVTVSLVQGALTQAIMAGKAPDAVLQLGNGDPLNLAFRGAVEPLDGYEGFDTLADDYAESSFTPFEWEGRTYALPETQSFFMMFVRTDVFAQLGLNPPETWQELYNTAQLLQQSNMEVGLPYSSMDAYSVVSQGMGTQSIFPTLLVQSGLNLYNDNHTATALDSPAAYGVFKMWTDFYTQYSFPLFKDDYTRFRTGQMPLIIGLYTFYNTLYAAAPEIRQAWKMLPIPGTVDESGTINRSLTASGTCCVMISTAKDKESAAKFLRWWADGKTQSEYGIEIENTFGTAGRYNPASKTALAEMPWSAGEFSLLSEQEENLVLLPEIPGGYYTLRNLDNAFRAVFYKNDNPREALNYWNRQINTEITRKRNEFGLTEKE